jgi:uncharacterized protein YgiM (DUF1202 family)
MNVYAGPAAVYDILGQATEGEALEILAQARGGDWLLVRFQDGRAYGLGWVWSPLLTLGDKAAEVPVAATVPPTPTR